MTVEEMQAAQLQLVKSFEELARAEDEREQQWREKYERLEAEDRERRAKDRAVAEDRAVRYLEAQERGVKALETIAATLDAFWKDHEQHSKAA